MVVLGILLGISVVVFGIYKFIESKKAPKVEAKVINKSVKQEYPKEDTKDKAIKKYNESKKNK
jgi:hypothetical protein